MSRPLALFLYLASFPVEAAVRVAAWLGYRCLP